MSSRKDERSRYPARRQMPGAYEGETVSPRDPSQHVDGLWKYIYPARPTT
jgi:hypothetical protein